MNATIEPSLLALLNSDNLDSCPLSPSLELPPLQDPNILKASGRPLLLEPDASHRSSKANSSSSQLVSQHPALISLIDDGDVRHDNTETRETSSKPQRRTERALGSTSPQSLRKILDDGSANASGVVSKKRPLENGKEDFVQLPQPLPKKQKSAKQVVVPPIINGIHELPPQVALFPPIASSSFHDSHGRNSLNMVSTNLKDTRDEVLAEESSAIQPESKRQRADKRCKRKGIKPYKKWTEEETSALLKGVNKYGIGCWADILGDHEFSFNDRTAVDLKDRFRTCCPEELRGPRSKSKTGVRSIEEKGVPLHKAPKRAKSRPMSGNMLISTEKTQQEDLSNQPVDGRTDNIGSTPHWKRGSHRKNLQDLAELGIEGPFRKSQRRGRRGFTEEDDRQILEGYNCYGSQWTKIQRDLRFQLQSRTPTDLRDRFRNRYPEKFHHTEDIGCKDYRLPRDQDSSAESQENVEVSSSALQNSSSREYLKIQQMISSTPDKTAQFPYSQGQPTQMSIISLTDSFLPMPDPSVSLPSSDQLSFPQSLDWSEGIGQSFTGSLGDMDISRLLLGEPWAENVPSFGGSKKQTYTNISSICTSSSDAPLSQVMSFTNLLGFDVEPLSIMHSSMGMGDYNPE